MTQSNSRCIESNQAGVHDKLEAIVRKHLNSEYRKPIAQHTQDAFEEVRPTVESALSQGAGLVFDSGCGTAMSSRLLALHNPDDLVLGIDRSAKRLGKAYNDDLPENACLVQAECGDFWRLAKKSGWKLKKHTILYPNPYPKASHLKRRWHAHPVFPTLLELGGEIELRTNWKTYADEFCLAFKFADKICNGVGRIDQEQSMTLFEKKYKQSGQVLYICKSKL